MVELATRLYCQAGYVQRSHLSMRLVYDVYISYKALAYATQIFIIAYRVHLLTFDLLSVIRVPSCGSRVRPLAQTAVETSSGPLIESVLNDDSRPLYRSLVLVSRGGGECYEDRS